MERIEDWEAEREEREESMVESEEASVCHAAKDQRRGGKGGREGSPRLDESRILLLDPVIERRSSPAFLGRRPVVVIAHSSWK